jgi:hypothetical protein
MSHCDLPQKYFLQDQAHIGVSSFVRMGSKGSQSFSPSDIDLGVSIELLTIVALVLTSLQQLLSPLVSRIMLMMRLRRPELPTLLA